MNDKVELLVEVKQGIAEMVKTEENIMVQHGMMKVIDMINVKLRLLEDKSLD